MSVGHRAHDHETDYASSQEGGPEDSIPRWLGEHEFVVAAHVERAAGPGASNRRAWVLVTDRRDDRLRVDLTCT